MPPKWNDETEKKLLMALVHLFEKTSKASFPKWADVADLMGSDFSAGAISQRYTKTIKKQAYAQFGGKDAGNDDDGDGDEAETKTPVKKGGKKGGGSKGKGKKAASEMEDNDEQETPSKKIKVKEESDEDADGEEA